MERRIEVEAQDVIDALTMQRDTALNELARAQAVIRTLQKQIDAHEEPLRTGNGTAHPDGLRP